MSAIVTQLHSSCTGAQTLATLSVPPPPSKNATADNQTVPVSHWM